MQKRSTEKSKKLLERARCLIPRASQTLSKAPDQFVRGVSPYAIHRANGCRVWDVDGNEYIDLASSLGAIVLGHQHPVVEEAVKRQRLCGTLFTLPGDLEVELAEKICNIIPFVESVRFGLNGSDVTTAAIRVARAYTGRDHIVKCGYHGWPDWTIGTHPLRSRGVPQATKDLTHEFAYNKITSLEALFERFPEQIAAVIMEPISIEMPQAGFLEAVRDLTRKHGAVFIFDELVTGFRIALGGAAEYFKVQPDLVCYGKAISNGEPLSVLGGRKEIMDVLDDVFFSFTYAGYLPSVAVSLAVLDFMQKNPVQKTLWETGTLLQNGYRALAQKYQVPTSATGWGPHPIFSFKNSEGNDNLPLKSLFIQETAKRGILTNCSNLLNYSHKTSDVEGVLLRLEEVFKIVARAIQDETVESLLEGPVIRPRSKPQS